MPAENILFPRPCYEGMISTSLEVIWEISVEKVAGKLLGFLWSDGCFGTVRTGWMAQFRAPKRPRFAR